MVRFSSPKFELFDNQKSHFLKVRYCATVYSYYNFRSLCWNYGSFPNGKAIENKSGNFKVLVYDIQVGFLVPFHLLALSGLVWGAFSAIFAAIAAPVSRPLRSV